MGAIRLVRGIIDSLQDVTNLDSLVLRFQDIDASYVTPIAIGLDLPQLVMLNYELTLSVAFYYVLGRYWNPKRCHRQRIW